MANQMASMAKQHAMRATEQQSIIIECEICATKNMMNGKTILIDGKSICVGIDTIRTDTLFGQEARKITQLKQFLLFSRRTAR